MARVIDQQTNPWGRQNQGIEPQRSDLWVVDLSAVVRGLKVALAGDSEELSFGIERPFLPTILGSYFAQSVTLPELKVRSEHIRRDSRPYQMPSWDEPCDAATMTFVLDCYRPGGNNNNPYTSDIYQVLDIWRAVVRAGRDAMSSEFAITLNSDYTIGYAFNIYLKLLRGTLPSYYDSGYDADYVGANGQPVNQVEIINDLALAKQFTLINCWLGGFKMSELNYEGGAKAVLLTATIYIEDICQEPITTK
jgi:hypothetical protein